MAPAPGACAPLRRAETTPGVVSRDVDIFPVRLLRARWRTPEVDVRPQEMLDADQVASHELEDQKLVGRSAVRETGGSGKRRQSLTRRRADFARRVDQRLHARPACPCQLVR